MDRPGLKRLLAEVQAGRVDVIVVYKVDRLTRALSDFARIVDTLDAAQASFVSITQAFNTTTSMARLTLNVLLSFAQFEREVISERVRDKIAASKAKGMWMGGKVPLGYDVHERKLVVNAAEAETVRHIMRRYLELGSVMALLDDLRMSGIVTKRQQMRDGSIRGAVPFTRGALYHLLKNRTYRGETVHHDKTYPGEHEAIVDAELFEAVQAQLAANIEHRRSGKRAASPSLLAGLIRDASDRPLSPSHAVKNGQRYRYYVSNLAVPGDAPAPVIRLPAKPLEVAVVEALKQAVAGDTYSMGSSEDPTAQQLGSVRAGQGQLALQLAQARTSELRPILHGIDLRLVVYYDQVQGSCCTRKLLTMIDPTGDWSAVRSRVKLSMPTSLQRKGHELRLRLDPAGDTKSRRDPKLISLIVRAHAARDELIRAGSSLDGQARRHLARIARASYLAPDIITAIFEGTQPRALSARAIERGSGFPICWKEQRQVFGLA